MVDDSGAALQGTTSMRLDKWLWAARFFKTRSLAVQAIHSGQVSVQGEPAKASRALRVGETVTIRLPAMQRTVRVLGLALMRGSSAAAAALIVRGKDAVAIGSVEVDTLHLSSVEKPALTATAVHVDAVGSASVATIVGNHAGGAISPRDLAAKMYGKCGYCAVVNRKLR